MRMWLWMLGVGTAAAVSGCGPGAMGGETGTSTQDGATGSGGGSVTGSDSGDAPPPGAPPPECELVGSSEDFPAPGLGEACEAYLDPRDLWTIPMHIHNLRDEPAVISIGEQPRIETPDGAWHHPLDRPLECSCETWLVEGSCIGPDGPRIPTPIRWLRPGGVIHHVWRGYLARPVTLPQACAASLECHKTAPPQPGPHVSILGVVSAAACQQTTGSDCSCEPTSDGSCSFGWPDGLELETIRVPFELGAPCDGVDVYLD